MANKKISRNMKGFYFTLQAETLEQFSVKTDEQGISMSDALRKMVTEFVREGK